MQAIAELKAAVEEDDYYYPNSPLYRKLSMDAIRFILTELEKP
jgi:hypothetical protein